MNRIDSQIDDMFKLLDMIDEHKAGVRPGFCPYCGKPMQVNEAQRKAERIDSLRLADLERQKGC